MAWSKITNKSPKPLRWWYCKLMCELGWAVRDLIKSETMYYRYLHKMNNEFSINLYGERWSPEKLRMRLPRTNGEFVYERPVMPQACTLRVENGTPFLFMPDGQRIPQSLDLKVEDAFEGDVVRRLAKVTVTVYANIADSK